MHGRGMRAEGAQERKNQHTPGPDAERRKKETENGEDTAVCGVRNPIRIQREKNNKPNCRSLGGMAGQGLHYHNLGGVAGDYGWNPTINPKY
mmetsp:Transcript_16358/g.36810  ORF Transcript_16358/g.36810 Transcript_16358/m.36810 type:complete len:92 (+) Transcript_16358:495-770(+)